MSTENTISQMRKGVLELVVLVIISRRPAYVSDILASLKEAEIDVVEGTLYPLLNRLKREEVLIYQWQESASGPPRKYYSLSPGGQVYLQEIQKNWEKLNQSIYQLLKE